MKNNQNASTGAKVGAGAIGLGIVARLGLVLLAFKGF